MHIRILQYSGVCVCVLFVCVLFVSKLNGNVFGKFMTGGLDNNTLFLVDMTIYGKRPHFQTLTIYGNTHSIV